MQIISLLATRPLD